MSVQQLKMKDQTYHFYHKGHKSQPAWAFAQGPIAIAENWVTFMANMPDTASAGIGSVQRKIADKGWSRAGTITITAVTGMGSKTKGASLGKGRQWEAWYDLKYDLIMTFVSDQPLNSEALAANQQAAIDKIAAAAAGFVV